jgi:uncharacterized membrane protein
MLYNLLASTGAGETVLEWIEFAALAIEVVAVVIIVVVIFYALLRYFYEAARHPAEINRLYRELKVRLGKSLLLGLEILVAADIVRTVALDTTIQAVAVLGLLVLIRTFLSWSLVVEIEERWPWQPRRGSSE